MSFHVSEIKSLDEFSALVPVEWEAYSTPHNSFWEILKGPSLEECTQRQWAWHTADPDSHWLKITDDHGTIVGGGQWVVHEEDPFKKPMPRIAATWWPEGSEIQEMADKVLEQFFSGRVGRMNRPHLLVGYCFVLPSHRRKGAARLFMDWGTSIADAKGMEAFVESTDDGRALYERSGFSVVNDFYIDPRKQDASEEYVKVKDRFFPQPQRGWFMWRPKGGRFVEGKTKYSWE